MPQMAKKEALKYRIPDEWFRYDAQTLVQPISRAESAVHAFVTSPFQLEWLEEAARSRRLQEVTATCALAGHFLPSGSAAAEAAGNPSTAEGRAAATTYDWIDHLSAETTMTEALLLEMHGGFLGTNQPESDVLRRKDQQAYFGSPMQRGAKGGRECREALTALVAALAADSGHPPVIRGLAAHYHLWTIHPFGQANGRTARGLDCFFRQAAGLEGPHFLAMAPFYFAEQDGYRETLGEARRAGHDLTAFLEFALRGLALECEQALSSLQRQTSIVLFRDTMSALFGQIRNGKKGPMIARQLSILDLLLDDGHRPARQVYYRVAAGYASLQNPWKAFLRDLSDLEEIGAVEEHASSLSPRLSWPAEISTARFLDHYNQPGRFSASARHPA